LLYQQILTFIHQKISNFLVSDPTGCFKKNYNQSKLKLLSPNQILLLSMQNNSQYQPSQYTKVESQNSQNPLWHSAHQQVHQVRDLRDYGVPFEQPLNVDYTHGYGPRFTQMTGKSKDIKLTSTSKNILLDDKFNELMNDIANCIE
jgi:hypothetical protein